MALDINTGYNATFKAFADFAQQRVNANDAKAVADAHVQKPLGGRNILAVTQSLTDSVHKWTRGVDEWVVNDRTRELFKKAVADMFGGENKIPASVKKAMLLSDYGEGKPLTARRILAVKAAIDADGTAKARAEKIKLETFASHEVEGAALALGYTKAEMPKLARAAHLYAQATGKSEMDAMKEVATPGSKANRLMGYGGRFLQNAANFEQGLRLVDEFAAWYTDLRTVYKDISRLKPNYANCNTVSKLNVRTGCLVNPRSVAGMEAIVFADIAQDASFNLAETDREKAFGFENNSATRFLGLDFQDSQLGTIAGLPFAKRKAVYAAFELLRPLQKSAAEVKAFNDKDAQDRQVALPLVITARILKNFDKVSALMAKGQFDAKNFFKVCFPDIKRPGNCNVRTLQDFDTAWRERIAEDEEVGMAAEIPIQMMMESTGCTIDEAIDAYKNGKSIAPYKEYSPVSFGLEEFDGTTTAGRKLLGGDVGDLARPYNYAPLDDENKLIIPQHDQCFGFSFPDGTAFRAGTAEKLPNNEKVMDKIEEMCGPVHKKQANAVLFAVSQSGIMQLKGGLKAYGIQSSEHSAVNFTLSRNEETGAVTVRYSSPEKLPVRFSWTATIDVDGNVTATPMVVEKPVEMDAKTAKAMVVERAKALGANLTGAQRDQAVSLLRAHGTNMFDKNAKLFAGFLVQLVRTRGTPEKNAQIAADTAKSIREWRDFGFGNSSNVEFRKAAGEYASNTIRKFMQPGQAGKFTDNVHDTMIQDAKRAVYTFNGTTYSHRPMDEVISAFKALVPDPKKQKALSTYLNQLCFESTMLPSNHAPYDTGVDANKIPGADMLANRDFTTGLYHFVILGTTGHDLFHDLQVSPDGKTATITQTISADLASSSVVGMKEAHFGKVTLTQRLVIDLEPEIPVVTDFQLAQTIE